MWRKGRKKHNKKQENITDLGKYIFSSQKKYLLNKTIKMYLLSALCSEVCSHKKVILSLPLPKNKKSTMKSFPSPEKHLLFSQQYLRLSSICKSCYNCKFSIFVFKKSDSVTVHPVPGFGASQRLPSLWEAEIKLWELIVLHIAPSLCP